MIVIGDTSGLVAALNVADPEHEAARAALKGSAATVVSPLVMLEIEHVTTRNVGRRAAFQVNDWVLKNEEILRVIVPELPATLLRRARQVQSRYQALELDLTNALNVALAEVYETDTVLTLDRRDFRAIKPLTEHEGFRLLPDDL
ncbi:PIN domain-containing protein [Antribacter sp. KLBMP9083]|uniref:Ribonuclease VapC n=1 Tax=Antribacter soli TaxID=2910976 RepID=A0AA41QCQ2_9MICO|nr:PIN domain-containing protein [Antribacter soli]MCF4120716.1 PIN domain-containing protein [Antribacter soli]